MEFLVEFDINVPDLAPRCEVEERESGEAASAARLAEERHSVRIWKPPVASGETKAVGMYRADSQAQLDLARGEDVDPSEYTFRTSTQIETSVPGLDWLNKGAFVGVAGRQAAGVIYETYLVE